MHKTKYVLLVFLISLLGVIGLSTMVAAAAAPVKPVLPVEQTKDAAVFEGLLPITDTAAYAFTNFSEFYQVDLNVPTLTEFITYTSYSIEASDFAGEDFSVLYGFSPYGEFFHIDAASGLSTYITYTLPISTLQWTGMAWDSASSQMYVAGYLTDPLTAACDDLSQSLFYVLDVATGTVSLRIEVAGVHCLVAFAAGANGLFYGLDAFSNQLVVFDANGIVVTAVPMPFAIEVHHGLDFDDATGLLYATTVDVLSLPELWVIDPNTMFSVFVGTMGYGDGQQFSSLAIASIYEAPQADGQIDPETGGSLEYVDPFGSVTRIEVPPGAVTQTVHLSFSPIGTPGFPPPGGTQFVNHNFELTAVAITETAYQLYLPIVVGGNGQAGQTVMHESGEPAYDFLFLQPLTFTIYYTDTDLSGSPEESLHLYYWNGSGWVDAIQTCIEAGILVDPVYTSNPAENYVQLPVCHLTRFGLVGS